MPRIERDAIYRTHFLTLRLIVMANALGAFVRIDLIYSSLSPVARAPVSLVVPADERGGAPGLVAFIAVAQALADELAPAATPTRQLAAVGA